MAYSQNVIEAFKSITTATLTTALFKKGLKNVWIRKSFPLSNDQERVVGPAFTLRFIPAREDLATPESWASPISTRSAIENMPDGSIAVIAADGLSNAGVFGDILCQRMKQRNVLAMITDGVVRDIEGVLQTGLGVWAAGTSAPPSVAGLTFINWQEPIGCGGVAVLPNDLMVADRDGAVVVPSSLVEEILEVSIEQEKLEEWIMDQVQGGASLPGLYPPNEENLKRYEDSRK
ncbi:MAG: ribonuclease activity regulator RraA [Rhodobacteraceae bacterium]|nr:ribonuclease activity regulator RraA [Paracoccaceae bacterium]